MIDWDKTRQLGTTELKSRCQIAVICDTCGEATAIVRLRNKSKLDGQQYPWRCAKCRNNDPEYRKHLKERWTPEYKQNASKAAKQQWTDEYRQYMSQKGQEQWTDEYRRRMATTYYNNPEYKQKLSTIQNQEHIKAAKSAAARIQWEQHRDEMVLAISKASSLKWQDPEYRRKVTNSVNAFYSDEGNRLRWKLLGKARWQDPEYKAAMLEIINGTKNKDKISEAAKQNWQNPKYKAQLQQVIKTRWDDPELRKRMTVIWTPERRAAMAKSSKEVWQDLDYRAKMAACHSSPEWKAKMAAIRAAQPRVSSLQFILYSMLDDLGVKYYREYPDKPADPECLIGPYTFDCVIPRPGKPTLLIECQGEYWHSQTAPRDNAKASYIANNFHRQYELKAIWEHEFKNKDKVLELLKYWLGIYEMEITKFEFSQIEVKPCSGNEYRELLAKYHYLQRTNRGGTVYGAYLQNELVAVCAFDNLVRQNIEIEGYAKPQIRELSRLCIHPRYQKKNFGSWFISQCMKLLPAKYRCIIAYCDTTFGHDGTVYKASNFELDREVSPSYWYVSEDGWVMHKKTLYNHAVHMHQKEAEYAQAMGYVKVKGSKKLRFIYRRT